MSSVVASAASLLSLPHWPRRVSSLVLGSGIVLAMAITLALALQFWQDRERALADAQGHNALHAQLLADQAARTVENAALALATLADAYGDPADAAGPMRQAILAQALVNQPAVRALALLDRQGRVLASTRAEEQGQTADLRILGAWPEAGRDTLGPFVAGRHLPLLPGAHSASAVAAPAGLGFVPLLRTVSGRNGEWLALALLHPDSLASAARYTAHQADTHVLLASHAGRLLAGTSTRLPGSDLSEHPVFATQLPAREHGTYLGQGAQGTDEVVAFRVAAPRPLVVLVERPAANVRAAWLTDARTRIVSAAFSVVLVLAVAVLAFAGLRARERERRRLDRAQERVAARERELSVVVRSVRELLLRTDSGGRLTWVSPRWEEVFGRSLRAPVGQELAAFVAQADRPGLAALFEPAVPGGVRQMQLQMGPAEGQPWRLFELTLAPLTGPREAQGFVGSALDVTERVQAQARLQEQLAFSARMLEFSPLPTSVLDARGHYLTVNRAWSELTGRDAASVIGRAARETYPADEAAIHEAQDRRVLTQDAPVRYELPYRGAAGGPRDLLLTKVRVPASEGGGWNILVSAMDVSELRRAARATQEARDTAEDASRTKSEFIANVSHELRTPLQAIIGFSELGIARTRGQEALAALFVDVLGSGRRMLALVDDLLDVARIDSAVGTIHLERADLRPLVREVQQEVRALVQARHMDLDVQLPAAPLIARVDPVRFQQVLRNVLSNAIKFSPPGSRILLEARWGDDGGAHLSVTDGGPGIPAHDLERIFEAFAQSERTRSVTGGTGLGLAISRKIIDAHGGSIRAENMAEGGSRFHIRLPPRSGETRPAPLSA